MNKNAKCASLLQKSVAAATAASLAVGSVAFAAPTEIVSTIDSEAADTQVAPGTPLAGVMAATAQIHEDIIEIQSKSFGENPIAVIGETKAQEPEETNDSAEWEDKLMADVDEYLNIRSNPSRDSEVVGRLRPQDLATILEKTNDEWYEIESGEVKGFVSVSFSLVGADAKAQAEKHAKNLAVCETANLRVRAEASLDSEILGSVSLNQVLEVNDEAEPIEGWVSVIYKDSPAYVSTEYVTIKAAELGTAMTAQEIAEADAAEAAARKAAQIASATASTASNPTPEVIYNAPASATADDETLLAALLMCEAGGSYEGMLAVGGVVMNRLRSGYAGSIRDVIFQRGQFTPAGSGHVDRTIANGVSDTARQAARDAISGTDITGGAKNFRAASSGHAGVNIGGNVFF